MPKPKKLEKKNYANWSKKELIRTLFLTLFIITTVTHSFAQAPTSNVHQNKTFNVGLKIVDFEYSRPSDKKEIVTAAIWYPTEAKPRPFTYYAEEGFQSRVALNSPVATKGGPYPLILFAHGAYGSGYNSAYFMEYLASHGYIAVAPDYIDTIPPGYRRQIAFSRIKEGNVGHPLRIVAITGRLVRDVSKDRDFFFSYLADHRFHHTSFVIDEMIKMNRTTHSVFYKTINEDALGICGHSLGGVTLLGKIGAHPDKRFKDDRIKAAVVFSAPAYPFESTSNNINIPIVLMAGDDDAPGLHPEIPRRITYDEVPPPKFYLVLKNATHFAFGNKGCGQTPLYQAVESNPQTNAICRYGLAFFEKYLRGNLSAGNQLKKSDSAWAYYIKEEKRGESFEWGKEPPPGKGGPGGIIKEMRTDFKRKRNKE